MTNTIYICKHLKISGIIREGLKLKYSFVIHRIWLTPQFKILNIKYMKNIYNVSVEFTQLLITVQKQLRSFRKYKYGENVTYCTDANKIILI